MNKVLTSGALLLLTTTIATAGGVDRSGQPINFLFEPGNYAEYSFGYVMPDVSGESTPFSGVAVPGSVPGSSSGNMSEDYIQYGVAVKVQLNDQLDAALILDQPYGANVDYPTGTGYFAAGSTAELNSTAITGLLKYTLPSNISVYGGLRYQTLEATASIPFVAGYEVDGEIDSGFGYVVGASYERPDIALRVSLTYNSQIEHENATSETSLFGPLSTTTEITTPQSLNLEFQTGIAAGTLVFGSVRWVEWSEFDISPAQYAVLTGGGSLVSYEDDTISYNIGIGRQLTENFAASIAVGYEDEVGGFASNLGPTDGRRSVTLGGTYTRDVYKITAGISYIDIGDAETTLGGAGLAASNFEDNSAIGLGIRVGYSF